MISILTFFLPKNTPWIQWTGCLATTVLMFLIGLMIGWTSPHVIRLGADNLPFQITTDKASLMIPVHYLGRILGSVFGGTSVHYSGSKRTLILNVFTMLCCWTLVIMAESVIWLYLARLATGFSHGATITSFTLYLGEVSSPNIRGALISLSTIGYPLGILSGTVMGSYFSMSHLAWISLAPTVATILVFIWVPESPHHLIRKGRTRRAWRSILRYNPGANVQVEFESLRNFVTTSNSPTFTDRLREFSSPGNMKSGMIAVALFVFMQASGLNTLTFYSEMILTRGRFAAMASSTAVIVLNSIGILSGLISMCLADTCGRRILWSTASAGSCIALVMIGAHFSFLDNGVDPDKLQWLLMVALVIWQVFTYVGVSSIPGMILGEIFSPNMKSMGACVASVSGSVFEFLFFKSYEPMVNTMGETYVLWMHAVLMLIAVIFGLTLLPETKGKSLQEIQNSLTNK